MIDARPAAGLVREREDREREERALTTWAAGTRRRRHGSRISDARHLRSITRGTNCPRPRGTLVLTRGLAWVELYAPERQHHGCARRLLYRLTAPSRRPEVLQNTAGSPAPSWASRGVEPADGSRGAHLRGSEPARMMTE